MLSFIFFCKKLHIHVQNTLRKTALLYSLTVLFVEIESGNSESESISFPQNSSTSGTKRLDPISLEATVLL